MDPSLPSTTYKQLRVSDFRALNPPPSLHSFGHKISAQTTISIRPVEDAKYTIVSPSTDGGQYVGRFDEIAFKAVMIPSQSWWNPELQADKTTYVLQHEQIHFALMEIAALRLNQKVASKGGQSIVGTTSKEVETKLLVMVDQWMENSKEVVLKEQMQFDEDTSKQHSPQLQEWWYNRVQKDIETLSASPH